MPTDVRYWYRTSGSTEEVEIATERYPDDEAEKTLGLIAPEGTTTTIQPDNQEKYGETKKVKVLKIIHGVVAPVSTWEDKPSTTASGWIMVVVTDPE